MYQKVILSAFAKAKMETLGNTKTQWADHLTDSLWCEFKYQISRRTLLNYYNYCNNKMAHDELSPKSKTIEYLCKYLCYPNYATFLMHHNGLSDSEDIKTQRMTYTLDGDGYKEQVTIHIRREYREALNVA